MTGTGSQHNNNIMQGAVSPALLYFGIYAYSGSTVVGTNEGLALYSGSSWQACMLP
jgi:hypothetical protein